MSGLIEEIAGGGSPTLCLSQATKGLRNIILFISKCALFIIMCQAASGALGTPHAGRLTLGFSATILLITFCMDHKFNKGMLRLLSILFIILATLNIATVLTAKQLGAGMLLSFFGFLAFRLGLFCCKYKHVGINGMVEVIRQDISQNLNSISR